MQENGEKIIVPVNGKSFTLADVIKNSESKALQTLENTLVEIQCDTLNSEDDRSRRASTFASQLAATWWDAGVKRIGEVIDEQRKLFATTLREGITNFLKEISEQGVTDEAIEQGMQAMRERVNARIAQRKAGR